jgi:hypothetical protein
MIKYEKIELPNGYIVINAELEDGTKLSIPSDPANSDYQAYLEEMNK